jgi:hypothetical protein
LCPSADISFRPIVNSLCIAYNYVHHVVVIQFLLLIARTVEALQRREHFLQQGVDSNFIFVTMRIYALARQTDQHACRLPIKLNAIDLECRIHADSALY